MTRTLKGLGYSVLVCRVRKQKCATQGCTLKSRLALVLPCLDIEEDGGPGLAAVVQCTVHMEDAIVRLAKGI